MPMRPGRAGAALHEPTSIVIRPSATTISRAAWVLLTVVASVTLLPGLGVWAPWMLVPLLVTAAVTGGAEAAVVWALLGGLALDLAPPASGAPGLGALPLLVAALVVTRLAPTWDDAAWVPALVGGLGAVAASLAVVALRVAAAGSWELDVRRVLAAALTTAVLTALTAPVWVTWTRGQQEVGRA